MSVETVIDDGDFVLLHGDALEALRTLPDESVHCVVTSPPYWGQRDYGVEGQLGLEPTLGGYVEALVGVMREVRRVLRRDGTVWLVLGDSYTSGGRDWREADERGPGGRGMGRGLRPDTPAGLKPKDLAMVPARVALALQEDGWWLRQDVIWSKPNAMPESVTDRPSSSHEHVLLLARSGRYFYDREAVREPYSSHHYDRPNGTVAQEETLEGLPPEAPRGPDGRRATRVVGGEGSHQHRDGERWPHAGRNMRDVWEIVLQPYKGAHFAVFPEELARRCVAAGASEKGCCPECGAPWDRVRDEDGRLVPPWWWPTCACGGADLTLIGTPTGGRSGDDPTLVTGRRGMDRPRGEGEGVRPITRHEQAAYAAQLRASPHRREMELLAGAEAFAHYLRTDRSGARPVPPRLLEAWVEAGWLERVEVPDTEPPAPVPAVVLDPFIGSGTTALVARKLGRRCVGIELSADHCEQIAERTSQLSLLPGSTV